jgi:hypothetical protein
VIAYDGGLVMDTLSQASAGVAGWERKSGMVLGHSRESGLEKTKNSTTEASMLLKTNVAMQGLWERSEEVYGNNGVIPEYRERS